MSHLDRAQPNLEIDRAADRLAYLGLSYGLLLAVIVRAAQGSQAWDLLALVITGGLIGLGYRAWKGGIGARRVATVALPMAIAGLAAAFLVLVQR